MENETRDMFHFKSFSLVCKSGVNQLSVTSLSIYTIYFISCGPTSSNFLKSFSHTWIFLHARFYAFLSLLCKPPFSFCHFQWQNSIFMGIFLLLLVEFIWIGIYFAKNWLCDIVIAELHFFIAFIIWVFGGEGLSILSVAAGWDFHSFNSELLYLLLTMRPFEVASWFSWFFEIPFSQL